jgi:putative membrane protein
MGRGIMQRAPVAGPAILAAGGVLAVLSDFYPSRMPSWAPWDFSWVVYLTTTVSLWWFARGLRRLPRAERPPVWRGVCFVLGILAIYAVLQTRFEYLSQHMFFLTRIQHVVIHHLGPFLIALGGAGAPLKRGMPARLRRLCEGRISTAILAVLQQPLLAAFLFVGLIYFFLAPPIEFAAMISPRLYDLMNWSMVVDGILFWSLVLDSRPSPPARLSYGVRAALAFGVMFPQILLGSLIALTTRDLYPFYDLCGRVYPSIGALADQHIGGIIQWIPPAMMSVVALVLVLNALRLADAATSKGSEDETPLVLPNQAWLPH